MSKVKLRFQHWSRKSLERELKKEGISQHYRTVLEQEIKRRDDKIARAARLRKLPLSNPRVETVRRVVDYLESIGLAVYGPAMDLQTGEATGANMDYDSEDVVQYRKLRAKNPDIPFYPEEDD